MKNTLIKGALLALAFGAATPASPADLLPVSGIINGLSNDGKYAVGSKAVSGSFVNIFESYIYTVQTQAQDWLTKYDESDLLHSGKMVAVTDDGTIAGNIFDPDMRLPLGDIGDFRPGINQIADGDEQLGRPLVSGAVWRGGKTYVLGCGPHRIEEFDQEGDGTEAVGITSDGNTVFGNLVQSLYQVAPVKWTYDAENDKYEYSQLELGQGAVRAVIGSVAGNGACAGFARINGADVPVMWDADGKMTRIPMPNSERPDYYWEVNCDAISPSGRFVLLKGSGNHAYLGIYDAQTGTIADIAVPSNTFEVKGFAVTDNGTAYVSVTPSTNYIPVLHMFSLSDGYLVNFKYYLEQVATGVAARFPDANQSVAGVSEDGLVIAGSTGGYSASSWVITLDSLEAVNVPAPENVRLFHSSVDELTLLWDSPSTLADGLTVEDFDVYVDREFYDVVSADSGTDGHYRLRIDALPGNSHVAYVVANARNSEDGKLYPSQDSEVAMAYVSAETSLLGYENFDDATVNGNGDPIPNNDYWTKEVPYGIVSSIIQWHLNVGNDYLNRSPMYATYAISEDPWASILTSRFHDASECDDFYLDFLLKVRLLNNANQDLSTDFIDLEASVDGEHWETVKRICAADLLLGEWNNQHIDMGKEWGGKNFQIRFNAHGEGNGELMWCLDNINFGNELNGEVPTGLTATRLEDDTVMLDWNSSLGTREVSHIYNSSYVSDYCLGDEGRPMIAAVKLTPTMLQPYVGQYLSAISGFVYDDPNIEAANPTRAEVMLFSEDNTLLSKGDVYSEFNEINFSAGWLDEPVKIEAGKSYVAGVRIYDYDSRQTPLYYQSVPFNIPFVTDLYSEDEGQTWRSVYEDLANPVEQGAENCVWPIRAHITPEPVNDTERAFDADLTHYVVYRDGEPLSDWSIYHSTPKYLDTTAADKGVYNVRAYYADGAISELSAPVQIDFSGIYGVESEAEVTLHQNGDVIVIEGDFDLADIIDMAGRRVLTSSKQVIPTAGLPKGVYLVSVHKDTARSIFKIVVR